MILIILLIPLLTFLIIIKFNRKLGSEGTQKLTNTLSILSILIMWSIYIFNISSETIYTIKFISWFSTEEINIEWGLLINKTTLTMLLLVITVAPLVNLYSINYMEGEPHLGRFISYLNLFTFFMLILVTAPNIVQLFVGWEGVGVCSYLLVSFWYTREKAVRSGFKAMAINKIGDMAFLMAMGIIFYYYQTMNITNLSIIDLYISNKINTIICILLIIAVMGKSAQIGLHTWLPAAMEGPTPVSALIHAATMVTAGVFLVVRLSPLFISCENALLILAILGGITCLISASIGCLQTDIKKVIAYSTCSQLGYMILICGYTGFNTSLSHLFNHGMFKALLFLSAGAVIHSLIIHQTFYKMSIKWVAPLANSGIIIGSFAICGFPFLTGFYSKDLLLELAINSRGINTPVICAYLAAAITCFYSIRLHYVAFRGESRYARIQLATGEIGWQTIMALSFLGLCSILMGYINSHTILSGLIKPMMVSNIVKLLPIIEALIILLLCQFILIKNYYLIKRTYEMIINKLWFDSLYSRLTTNLGKFSMKAYGLLDQKIMEWISSSLYNKTIKNITSSIYKHKKSNIISLNRIILLTSSILLLLSQIT